MELNPPVDENETFIIKVKSAGKEGGDVAEISINDVPVEMEENEKQHYRGLHIVIINILNSFPNVETSRVFDTYSSSAAFEEFIQIPIPKGHIIAAACKDDMVTNLSPAAKAWFTSLGSQHIETLNYR